MFLTRSNKESRKSKSGHLILNKNILDNIFLVNKPLNKLVLAVDALQMTTYDRKQ